MKITKEIENIILTHTTGLECLELYRSTDLPKVLAEIIKSYESRLVAAFTAGEELGHRNAKSIYRFTKPEEEVSQAAPKYAKSIINDTASK